MFPKGINTKERVVVAMSGGVDSSVAALLLKEAGYEVIGVSLELHDFSQESKRLNGSCCTLEDLNDARRVAHQIGIPFYLSNMVREFEEGVIKNFVEEYQKGRTPNPCVRCNQNIKFRTLMDWALDLGAKYLATGHYAQIVTNNGSLRLCRGVDAEKDQSYFLFTLTPQDLQRTLFPVGSLTKSEVRTIAHRYGLATALKEESQDICFVSSRSYTEFIDKRSPFSVLRKGEIVDVQGSVLGYHDGLHRFTIGQRKGLNVPSREPLYVVRLDKVRNQVVVGSERLLYSKTVIVRGVNWLVSPEQCKDRVLTAKIRYRAREAQVKVEKITDQEYRINFFEAQRAVTPGQALVLYDGSYVVGGGWIERVEEEHADSI